ncbi:MAG: DUF3149 domain-containing protein [Piscinibacter sp.]|nr:MULTISPECIES: DUF3149 domain-containing protein [Piscinibacter]MCW5665198.1 DUF3149 domain-containing protein [Piscinibacter sp.]
MRALTELFTTDVGLLSIAVIAITLGMGGYYLRYFIKHVREDSEKQATKG